MFGYSLRPLIASLVLVRLLWVLPGCSSEQSRASTEPPSLARSGGQLVVGVQQEPERLCEILNATATTGLVCNLIFSKFVKYDDELRLVPDLIEAIPTHANGGISADNLTYTYRLRADARWHDGRPVTSADVEFTYDVIMDPQVSVESREGWDVIERIATPDERTVVFTLSTPYPDFVAETFYDESVLPRHLLDAERGPAFDISGFHRAPVGSGPFVFEEWVSGSHIVVKRNDDFYGEGPYLDRIVFKFVPDENTLLVQLETGEIDVYDNANLTSAKRARSIDGVTRYATPTMMYEHLDLNLENPILSDRRVRQALARATDKALIADKIYGGLVTVAPLDEHPTSRYFNAGAAARTDYDPATARRLLREAGWFDTDGDGFVDKDGQRLVLTISATAGNPDRERTELVLRDMYRQVGIDLEIRNYDSSVLYGSFESGGVLKRGRFDIALYAWLSSPEPATKQSLYASGNIPPNGQNHPRIRHDELTALLERGANEVDAEKRIAIYHEASDILVEEAPVIPLFWYTAVDLCTTRLRNYRPNPTQSADTWNANTWYLAN